MTTPIPHLALAAPFPNPRQTVRLAPFLSLTDRLALAPYLRLSARSAVRVAAEVMARYDIEPRGPAAPPITDDQAAALAERMTALRELLTTAPRLKLGEERARWIAAFLISSHTLTPRTDRDPTPDADDLAG